MKVYRLHTLVIVINVINEIYIVQGHTAGKLCPMFNLSGMQVSPRTYRARYARSGAYTNVHYSCPYTVQSDASHGETLFHQLISTEPFVANAENGVNDEHNPLKD